MIQVYRWILYHVVLYSTRFQNEWPQPWHPSSLIFSRCGVEVSQNKQSKPEYNSFGKYWLKLYFMVSLRLIYSRTNQYRARPENGRLSRSPRVKASSATTRWWRRGWTMVYQLPQNRVDPP